MILRGAFFVLGSHPPFNDEPVGDRVCFCNSPAPVGSSLNGLVIGCLDSFVYTPDLFPSWLAVVVLGKEQLQNQTKEQTDVALMLQGHGIRPIQDETKRSTHTKDHDSILNLGNSPNSLSISEKARISTFLEHHKKGTQPIVFGTVVAL